MNQRERSTDTNEAEAASRPFQGFKPPTSSTTYTPNQFFDVVLPYASRGCLRLVAYLVRKTLGWSDEHGNPQNPHTHVTYRELIENAGISRGAIKEAIEEAIERRYIDCLRFGQPHRAGEEGFSALYSLRWDERENYFTSPEEFNGFFAGNGNLTHIPNDFFDFAVPNESLGVVRVVGVIIRHTIGFQTRYGFRRQHVEMSFTEIMRRTGISSSSTVSAALKAAVEGNYIRKVSEGVFDPGAGVTSKATTFSVCWDENPDIEPKNGNGSKIEADPRFKNRSGDFETVQKSKRGDGTEIEAGIGPISEAVTVQKSKPEAFKNRSDIKTTRENNSSKQQQTELAVVASGNSLSLLTGKLIAEGIDPSKAAALVQDFPAERILRQLEALPNRKVKTSKTGFLIRAIELDIPVVSESRAQDSLARKLAAHFYAELGGNEGEPVAHVSNVDEDAATSLLGKFPPQLQDNPEQIGRDFGQYLLKQTSAAKFPVRTLTLAVRSYGDEFLSSRRARFESQQRQRAQEMRVDHEKAFQSHFLAYQRTLAAGIESTDPELWAEFKSWVSARIERRRRMSEVMSRRTQEQFEDPDGRVSFVIEFLSETRPDMVLSFWDWDTKLNPERFSTEGTK